MFRSKANAILRGVEGLESRELFTADLLAPAGAFSPVDELSTIDAAPAAYNDCTNALHTGAGANNWGAVHDFAGESEDGAVEGGTVDFFGSQPTIQFNNFDDDSFTGVVAWSTVENLAAVNVIEPPSQDVVAFRSLVHNRQESRGRAGDVVVIQGVDFSGTDFTARLYVADANNLNAITIVVEPYNSFARSPLDDGQLKVQFRWDTEERCDENSSCWIRISQVHAGQGFDGIDIPRIGKEVIVDFLEGDPDRPIIIGRVYHAENMPPFGLPPAKNISGINSNSTQGGGGYNELVLDDTQGSELIREHGQFDKDSTTENELREHVLHDRSRDVTNNETISIDNDRTEHVGNNEALSVTAGDQISLTTGKANIVMKKDGTITITGKDITITGKGQITDEAMKDVVLKGMNILQN